MIRLAVTFFFLLVSIFAPGSALSGGPFTYPEIPDGQTVTYQYQAGGYPNNYLIEVKRGEEVLESMSRVEVAHREDGRKVYRIRDTGSRRNGFRFEQVTEILAGPELEPLGFTATDRNPQGRLIREMKVAFDDDTLAYPAGTFPVFGLVQVMRGASFQTGSRADFHVWVAPTEIFSMSLEVTGQAKVRVPAGEILCYAAEMKPDIRSIIPVGGLLSKLLQPFIPKYRFWFAADRSHPLVKFEGVLGAAGAAKHTIELKRIEEPTA
jgi:hypothetical protein